MAKSNKLKKLELLRNLSKTVEKRKKLVEHYRYLLTKSALLEHDVQKLRAEVEELRQYMPDDIPADIDRFIAEKTNKSAGSAGEGSG